MKKKADPGAAAASAAEQRHAAAAKQPVEELKMVLIVNDELKMGKGKIAAQCAHAAVGAVETLSEQGRRVELTQWEMCGQPKIALKCPSWEEMKGIMFVAKQNGVPSFVVQDAGRTQVEPGSRTVLALGPAPKSLIDNCSAHLKLL